MEVYLNTFIIIIQLKKRFPCILSDEKSISEIKNNVIKKEIIQELILKFLIA